LRGERGEREGRGERGRERGKEKGREGGGGERERFLK
jgi:hypothetical protein